MDNFQNINVFSLKFAILLRFSVPYVVRFYDSRFYRYSVVFGAKPASAKETASFENITCPISKFHAADLLNDYCISVDFTRFSLLMKPTSCTIRLAIFPPAVITEPSYYLEYPQPFHFKYQILSRTQATPSFAPSVIGAILYSQLSHPLLWNFTTILNWIHVVQSVSPHSYRHDVFLFLNAFSSHESSFHALDSHANILSADALKICPTCLEGNKLGSFIKMKMHKLGPKLLVKQAFVTTREMLIWRNFGRAFGKNLVITNMLQQARSRSLEQFHKLWYKILSA